MSFKSLSLLLLVSQLYFVSLNAQNFKILHYTETSGYDHGTRKNSLAMFQSLGAQHGFTVDDDQTGAAFNSLTSLQEYAVVVFSNTSGDQILDSTQRANFEIYIQNGGSLLGIHAASDTYRHSTANGSNTGTWDAYAELLGGSVQQSPNHTSANYNGTMDHIGNHPSTAKLPDPWNKIEEYYYWENGYYNPNNVEVLRVRSTGSNSYDQARPMSWHKEMFKGARLFYTALGHANSNFTSDTAFQNHIKDALLWAANHNISLDENPAPAYRLFPNPATNEIYVNSPVQGSAAFRIIDLSGKTLQSGVLQFSNGRARLQVKTLETGHYSLKIDPGDSEANYSLPLIIRK